MFWCLFLVMVSLSWLSNISTQWGLVLLVLDVDFCLWPCLVEPYMSKWLYARQLPIRTHFTALILILFIILSKIWSVCLEKEKKIELLMRAQNCFISDGSLKINTIPCWYKLSVFLVLIFFFFLKKVRFSDQINWIHWSLLYMRLSYFLCHLFVSSYYLLFLFEFLTFLFLGFSRWNSFLLYCDLFCFSLLVYQFPFFSSGNVCSPLLPYSTVTDYGISSACQCIPYLLCPSDRVWLLLTKFFF